MMEFQCKWLAALLVLVMATQKATSARPRVVVQSTGDTWITLEIEAPPRVRGMTVAAYRINIDEKFSRDRDDTRFVSTNLSGDPISVTLGQLNPSTTYMLRVTPTYRDMTEGEPTRLEQRTLQGEEMMSSGMALTSYRIAYFIIYVIVSWVVGFSVNM